MHIGGIAETGVAGTRRPGKLRWAPKSISLIAVLVSAGILGGCAGLVNGAKTTIQAAFQVNPTAVNFGNVGVGKKTTQTISVSNTGNTTVSITQATLSNPQFSLTGVTLPMSMATGQSGNFTVGVTPTATGTVTGTLTVQGNDGSAPAVVNLSATAVAAAAQISLSSSSVAFGTVTLNSQGNANLTISNIGGSDLTISQISVTGAEFAASGITPPKTISAGQSGALSLTFHPTTAGAVTGSVKISSNDTTNPTVTVSLAGTGSTTATGQLQASPAALSFGTVSTGGSATQHVTLTNTGTAPVQITSVGTSGAGFTVNGVTPPLTLNAAATTTLNVVFAPTSGGSVTGSLSVVSNANGSPTTIALSGTGGQAVLGMTPSSAAFGNVTVGLTNSQTIRLSNTGTATLTITQANVTGTGFGTTGLTLPLSINAGQSSTFNAQFQPTSAGTASGTISIVSNAVGSPSAIGLSGTGVAATELLSFGATSFSFGNVDDGSSSTQSETITNTGNSNVQISQIAITGAGYSLSGASTPVTLTPSQKLTFSVIFSPTVVGSLSGSVTVTSNATGSPTNIALSGSGVSVTPHTVSLSWTASTSTVSGYNVYRSTTNGSGYSKLNGALVASVGYTDSAVQNGTTYYYVTTAVDGSGNESSYSNQAQAIIP